VRGQLHEDEYPSLYITTMSLIGLAIQQYVIIGVILEHKGNGTKNLK
jgi:hypothetical protein